ncbi:MAG: tetratricopeptide repeat protein [Acidobacteria bacterium]|nr:tetratricopeptide repeat protein [Acidobacteriota bacterium]
MSIANDDNLSKIFAKEILKPEEEVDLGRAALLMAKCEYIKLDIDFYLSLLDEIASVIKSRLPEKSSLINPLLIIKEINEHIYEDLAFQGNKENYYDPRNSFLNEVLVRRLGIPITLSVFYMEIARRLGLKIDGVGMPGHFLMKCYVEDTEIILDAFNQGQILDKDACQELVSNLYGSEIELRPSFFRTVSKKEILIRMLNNLKNIYLSSSDHLRALATIERLLLITPQAINEIRDRGFVNYRLGKYSLAIQDLEFYLTYAPKNQESEVVSKGLQKIKAEIASLN